MPYGIRITLDGADITHLVSSFEITARLDAYCRELSLDIADPNLYDTLDFSVLPTTPSLEVFTRIESTWVSQGEFFVEKPTYSIGTHSTDTGLWGRSQTAALGPPFAMRFTKTWETGTSFFSICDEMCTAAGLTWNESYCDLDNFTIHARTFTVENLTPAEVIQALLELAHGEDAYLTTDAAGHVVIAARDRSPSSADHSLTDAVTASFSEEPEWPDFGNRIRVTSSGSTTGYSIQVTASTNCLSGNGTSRAQLYARVTDADGEPVEGVPVEWEAEDGLATLDAAVTNTQSIYIFDEEVRANSFYTVDLKLPPALVRGVYAYGDARKQTNFADGGVEIDGNKITLTDRLTYCDQLLRVSYVVDGVAVNWATGGITPGTETVNAEISGQRGSVDLYTDNPCNCPPTLTLSANPSSIMVGEASSVLAYVEMGGAPAEDGRLIWMSIDSSPPHGRLFWTRWGLGKIEIKNELVQAKNEVAGTSQCTLSMFADSVSGVYRVTVDGDGNRTKTGSSIYDSHTGKTVSLTTRLASETELLVDYVALGAAANTFDGYLVGTDRIRAFLITSREEPLEATTSISVTTDEADSEPDDPEGCCNEGLCRNEGTPCDSIDAQCEEGLTWCLKAGVVGCNDPDDCDECESGKVVCKKDGEDGCFDPDECDETQEDGGTPRVYGLSDGVEGCHDPTALDPCGSDQVYCFKDGKKGCYDVADCDSSSGVSEAEECKPGTICCRNKETGEQGCWPTNQCESKVGKRPKEHDKDPNTVQCIKADGSVETCSDGKTCCEKGGVRGCHTSAECDSAPGCATASCQEDPTEECLGSRFAGGLAQGCSCSELCEQEFANTGTTASYDSSSYRQISEIVSEDYSLTEGTPEYDEKYDELKNEALEECRKTCGDCENAEDLVVSGSDAVTKPGGYQYTASGGFRPYTWEVSGTGATIDDDGYVTLADGACGSFTVTVQDACGMSTDMTARITNNGQWVLSDQNLDCAFSAIPCAQCGPDPSEVISGDTKTIMFGCEQISDPNYYYCTQWFTPVQIGPNQYCVYESIQIFKWQCL